MEAGTQGFGCRECYFDGFGRPVDPALGDRLGVLSGHLALQGLRLGDIQSDHLVSDIPLRARDHYEHRGSLLTPVVLRSRRTTNLDHLDVG